MKGFPRKDHGKIFQLLNKSRESEFSR